MTRPDDDTAADSATGAPPLDDRAAAWLHQVRRRYGGGHLTHLAVLLAERAQPPLLSVELDQATVRLLLQRVHLVPAGLRALLARLVAAGLLVVLRPAAGSHWGGYALAGVAPAGSADRQADEPVPVLVRVCARPPRRRAVPPHPHPTRACPPAADAAGGER
jgi:hypothetical protein